MVTLNLILRADVRGSIEAIQKELEKLDEPRREPLRVAYKTAADARTEDVEEIIRSTGFFRQKTKSLLGMAEAVVERHGGDVPGTMKDLVKLPGVGRKTANVVLGNAFDRDEGVVVDTHVRRLSGRLGLTKETSPEKIEQDLIRIVPKESWTDLPHLFIYHGRAVCKAPTPLCDRCVLADICPSAGLV